MTLYLAGMALSLVVASATLLDAVWQIGENAVKRTKDGLKKVKNSADHINPVGAAAGRLSPSRRPERLEGWVGYIAPRLERAGWDMDPYALFVATLALGMAGAFLGAAVVKNLAVGAVMALCLASLPLQVLNYAAQKREKALAEQMPLAIQTFVAEFEGARNIREALARTARSAANPLKGCLEKCLRDLAASRTPDAAFNGLAAAVGNDYGRIWARMLLAATRDQTVVKIMPKLALRLSARKVLERKNAAEMSGERKVGVILNLLILPCFFVTQAIFPDTREFFVTQPLGKVVAMFVFISIALGLVLDQLLGRVEV